MYTGAMAIAQRVLTFLVTSRLVSNCGFVHMLQKTGLILVAVFCSMCTKPALILVACAAELLALCTLLQSDRVKL